MKQKITIKNIKAYIEGNSNMLIDNLGLKSKEYQEQIAYRMLQCGDCLEEGKCTYCGCDIPGKLYVSESCNNGDRFPNLMSPIEWRKYKEDNKIE